MKIAYRFFWLSALIICGFGANAQYRLLYESFSVGGTDTSRTEVFQTGNQIKIQSGDKPGEHPIPGTAKQFTYIDYSQDTIFNQLFYSADEQYFSSSHITQREFTKEGNEKVNGYHCTKYSIVLFSNKIELWVTEDLKCRATPASGFASLPGVLIKYCRNGNSILQLAKASRFLYKPPLFPMDFGIEKSSQELTQLEKEKLVLTYPIFKDEQICFNPKLPKAKTIEADSVYHFANGTIILKKVNFQRLPEHYQIFAEVTERSNGDAYDRTGSIFIIPANRPVTMIQALIDSIGILPFITGRDGSQYQGMTMTKDYLPPIELVRFFTPFGVGHYNQYRSLDGKEWEDDVHYKQDITDFRSVFDGDVYICAFIGNYDGGGHKLSLTLKAYPENGEWMVDEQPNMQVIPLFNTCNVMEMAGQNYGRLFGTDSLTVSFEIPENCSSLKLRYVTTGHGGWDNGDEFVPKANTILIDGEPRFVYTPWRCDCGTYRTSNPASGDFWNGMSSSDYSRSGWCPGTATQPVFFDLSSLKPGTHTITIAIPQGDPEGNSFSAWSVSGTLIGKTNNKK